MFKCCSKKIILISELPVNGAGWNLGSFSDERHGCAVVSALGCYR
jgi:hypothetical protein